MGKKTNQVRVNERVNASAVRLISAEGKQLGIVSSREALRVAQEQGLDLVEVAPDSNPPVCRIMDYGKFKYETAKKVQEARKKARGVQVKEIKFRPHTDEHDLGYKIKNLRKFLEKKHRVKLTVFFRGREMAYIEPGVALLKRVAEEVEDLANVDHGPTQEARNRVTMILIPK
ncbi:MAG: translation initiation factor IF-3 [Deltaproteobacteria bacterium]|nr:MAG: translation initiation factor IF-3 [Deltaproteobacteria bacterium]